MSHLNQELNERSRYLLKWLLECYIAEGQPVVSAALSRDKSLGVSPVTIRNIMAG